MLTNKTLPTTLALGAAVVSVGLWVVLSNAYPANIMINEVSFSGNDGNDWVELYNPSLNSISLKDYYVSDNERDLTKFRFTKDIVVPSHGYVVLYGEDYTDVPFGAPQLSFSVANGETLFLVAQNGTTIIDRLTVIGEESASVGRFPDGSDETFTFSNATPGKPNDKDERGPMRSI